MDGDVTVGYLLLFSALLGYSLLGIFHKVADRPQCRPNVIAAMLLFWGGVLTTTHVLVSNPGGLNVPYRVAFIGAAGGVFAGLALLTFQSALRFGKISTSWLILQLSVSVPILVSLVVYRERLNLGKVAGVGLVLGAIILLWWDKRTEREKPAGAADDATHATPLAKVKWLPLMILAFLANGLAASSQKVLSETFPGQDFSWQFTVSLYWTGFLFTGAVSLLRNGLPNRQEGLLGLIMAVASVAGNVLLVKAMGEGVSGSVAYPIANGGSLFIVVAAGVLLFKERLTPAGVAGVLLGLAAILVLMLT